MEEWPLIKRRRAGPGGRARIPTHPAVFVVLATCGSRWDISSSELERSS
jgi:hypothetical protein